MDFNPRTREGCDNPFFERFSLSFDISIHAPVKGATNPFFERFSLSFDISIHAPVKGATCYYH